MEFYTVTISLVIYEDVIKLRRDGANSLVVSAPYLRKAGSGF
jgi:hypothetical protein